MNQTHEATVGQRGQIVIPKPIREAASINPGATLQFSFDDETIVLRRPAETLDAFLEAIEKEPEPDELQLDELYTERFV